MVDSNHEEELGEEEEVDELGEPIATEGLEGQEGEPETVDVPVPTPPQPVSEPVSVLPAVEEATEKAGSAVWGQPEAEPPTNDMSDLFAVPESEDNDMYIDDLFETDDEEIDMDEDLSDLTSVTREDIMGAPPKPKPPVRYVRTTKKYIPPTSVGGLR